MSAIQLMEALKADLDDTSMMEKFLDHLQNERLLAVMLLPDEGVGRDFSKEPNRSVMCKAIRAWQCSPTSDMPISFQADWNGKPHEFAVCLTPSTTRNEYMLLVQSTETYL